MSGSKIASPPGESNHVADLLVNDLVEYLAKRKVGRDNRSLAGYLRIGVATVSRLRNGTPPSNAVIGALLAQGVPVGRFLRYRNRAVDNEQVAA